MIDIAAHNRYANKLRNTKTAINNNIEYLKNAKKCFKYSSDGVVPIITNKLDAHIKDLEDEKSFIDNLALKIEKVAQNIYDKELLEKELLEKKPKSD